MPFTLGAAGYFFRFFALGVGLAVVIFSFQYAFCNVKFVGAVGSELANILISAILGGLILGFLEELVMRCLIMRSIYTAFDALSAVVLSSLFFAYKHFKVPNSIWDSLPEASTIRRGTSAFSWRGTTLSESAQASSSCTSQRFSCSARCSACSISN